MKTIKAINLGITTCYGGNIYKITQNTVQIPDDVASFFHEQFGHLVEIRDASGNIEEKEVVEKASEAITEEVSPAKENTEEVIEETKEEEKIEAKEEVVEEIKETEEKVEAPVKKIKKVTSK